MWYNAVGCLVMLTLSMLVAPLFAVAQPAGKVPTIGYLFPGTATQTARNFEAFTQGLRALGYIEGQHIAIEQRYADGRLERLPALAAELVQRHVDVLVAGGPEVTLHAARQATSTTPIVMVAVDYDPIALGYIAGLPRPGGQITGLFLQQIEVTGKCLELLKDALPQVTRVAVLWDATSADQFRAAEGTARG
jgi:putative ABC transport system substrate-binding protein